MSSCINNTLVTVDEISKIASAIPPLGLGIGFGRTFIAGSLWLGGTIVVLISKLFACICCSSKNSEKSLDDIVESRLSKLQGFNAKTLKQTAHGILEMTCLKMPLAIALHQDAEVNANQNYNIELPFCTLTEKELYYEMGNNLISAYKAAHIGGCIPVLSLLPGSVRVLTHLGLVVGNVIACIYNVAIACCSNGNCANEARSNLEWHAKALLNSNLYGIGIGISEILQIKGIIVCGWYLSRCADSSKK